MRKMLKGVICLSRHRRHWTSLEIESSRLRQGCLVASLTIKFILQLSLAVKSQEERL